MRVGEGWRGRREEGLSSFGELMWERGRANITNDTTLSTIHVGLDFIQISSGVIVDISVLLSLVSCTFSQFFSRLATSYCNHASMTINRLWSFWTSMKKLDIRHVMMKVAAPAMKKIRWTQFVASPLECRYAAWRIGGYSSHSMQSMVPLGVYMLRWSERINDMRKRHDWRILRFVVRMDNHISLTTKIILVRTPALHAPHGSCLYIDVAVITKPKLPLWEIQRLQIMTGGWH